MEKLNILYVDDEDINLMLFKINLGKKYEIYTALDPVKGLEILESNSDIKVVLSDMKMPFMNGIEFIKKAGEKYPEIYYYILTGYNITEEIENALQEGLILKYFQKPFNMKDIDKNIEDILSKKE